MLQTETMVKVEPTGNTVRTVSPTDEEDEDCPSLPRDLILEILLRLPVRSLVQFRCVCKSWKALISHPQFAKDHLRASIARQNSSNLRLFSPLIGGRRIVSNPLQSLLQKPASSKRVCFTMHERYRILGSCNGLLCLIDSLRSYLTLWNPSTRVISRRFLTGFDICNTFIIHHGFGYDHVNNTFKLLVAMEGFNDHEIVTKVLSFGSNSWEVIPNFPYRLRPQGKCVSSNSTLNWLGKRGAEDEDQWMIFSFDLGTEKYREIFLPAGDFDEVYFSVIDAPSKSESLCISFLDSKKAHWVVWLMNKYGVQSSWTIFTTIPTYIEGDHNWNKWSYRLKPLYISEDGDVVFQTQVFKVVLYNRNDGKLAHPTLSGQTRFHNMYIGRESLISPPC